MKTLHRGLDGLDVSFMGQIDAQFVQVLESAKEQAQRSHRPTTIDWKGVRLLVLESGAHGGYAFAASTGPFGATWFFKKPNARDPWGVRASCNSFNLAINGLGGARSALCDTLQLLGIHVESESIARVDYAVDFLAPDFELCPERFVMHSNANRSDHIEHPEISANGRSGRVTSVTVGKMPGRQVIVYDKRAEVIAKNKEGWWVIWNGSLAAAGLPSLNKATPTESRVWRVELRAGKHHLKERWGIRTWADLDSRFGDLIAATLDSVRYTLPTPDRNRSRWPESELWNCVRRETEDDLFEMRLYADPEQVKLVEKESHDRLLASQMTGLLLARAALSDICGDNLPSYARATGEEMARNLTQRRSHFEVKLHRVRQRYALRC